MEKLYTCNSGIALKIKNHTFYAWNEYSESYEPGQHEILVDSLYLEDYNGDYKVMDPSKVTIL